MRMLVDVRRGQKIKDLSIEINSEDLASGTAVDEHLYLKQPRRLRLAQEGDEGAVYVENEGNCAAGTAARLKRRKCEAKDLISALFVPGDRGIEEIAEELVKALQAAGIDTEMVALGRDEEQRFIYIIGARVWEPDKPQLWLSKATFLPLRLRARMGKAGEKGAYEVRFLDYGSETAGNWFPKVLEEYIGGELVRRSEVTKIKLNENLPESMFVIP